MPTRPRTALALSRNVSCLVTLAALALGACGDDTPDLPGGTDPARFIGTWAVSVGSFSCPGLGQTVPLAGESVAVAAGSDAPITATVRGCAVKFDISGLEGTARAPQTCQVSVTGIQVPVDLSVTSGKFTVVPGTGSSATGVLMLAGNVTLLGMPAACTATANVNRS